MAEDPVRAAVDVALQQLQAERSSLVTQVQDFQRKRDEAAGQLSRVDAAIASLKEVRVGAEANLSGESADDEIVADSGDPYDVPPLPAVPPGPGRLEPFIKSSGAGKNLQSTYMVAAVVDAIAEPVTRDVLQRAFFDYFGHEQLAPYWTRPEKAFLSALQRAVERDMINRVEYPNGGEVYIGGFRVVDAHRRQRVKLKVD
ncbi:MULTISPECIES: hypothetical protein [Mycobacterium]|uniref:hypothetical protein n=1 Tax=Mycobacterium TaxID=1763 RepID=UPI00059C3ED5|nr:MULTISPECIES: hypothetical protein [Mycobacterium]ASW99449.1 hypothetical protein CKJ58_05560 [Mycobacterium intracellulare subsp. chimaera]PBA54208.1 hypothetical protein CKJ57_05390 [Mycobacterium intracellulare subsp. chimaera]PBA62275.1 hypothetical protein CKJ56_04915 [Mycobacterium intracellulare subsp. chimaera]